MNNESRKDETCLQFKIKKHFIKTRIISHVLNSVGVRRALKHASDSMGAYYLTIVIGNQYPHQMLDEVPSERAPSSMRML